MTWRENLPEIEFLGSASEKPANSFVDTITDHAENPKILVWILGDKKSTPEKGSSPIRNNAARDMGVLL